MNKTLLFSMNHIKNNVVNLTRTISTSTAEGRETITALATILDQLNAVKDHLKAI